MTDPFCPFCFLRKTISQISKDIALKVARVPGVHIRVKEDRCTGCESCVRNHFCLINAISVQDRRARIDDRLCRGCGRCTHFCPRKALEPYGTTPDLVNGAVRHINQGIDTVLK